MSRRSILALVAGVAVLFAALGWFGGQQISSPAEEAAKAVAPPPSLLTVPIVFQELSKDLTTRGTARSTESSDLTVSSSSGSSIVTKITKEAGANLNEGDVAIEVSGRPVILLEGELPVFRNFIPTLEGPDVKQLEDALERLGHNPGKIDGIYDANTADAVSRMYVAAGYKAPEIAAEDQESLKQANKAVDAEKAAVRQAEKLVTEAQQGPAESTKLQQDQFVSEAKNALAEAEKSGEADLITKAKGDLALAEATRSEALKVSDAADEKQAVIDAKAALSRAQNDLAALRARVNVELPAEEVAFLPTLPRTVQNLTVKIGDQPTDSVMTITGQGTSITAPIAKADRSLVEVGDAAILDVEDLGLEFRATITFVADSPGGPDVSSDRYLIRLESDDDLPEEALGVSFRITIPVTSTGGEVLAVPLAALSAGTNGTARVEVERSEGNVELIEVVPGLRADGLVEIKALDGGNLEAGDRVVVGRDLVLPGQDGDADESDENSDADEDALTTSRPRL